MRRFILLLASISLPLLLASGVALAATRVGDDGPNFIVGTNQPDTLIGLGGNDRISGKGDNDVVIGEAGHDRLTGGFGDDEVFGGAGDDVMGGDFFPVGFPGSGTYGNDTLYGENGDDLIVTRLDGDNPRSDTIFCGDGRDTVYVDPIDTVAADCERVRGTGRSLVPEDSSNDLGGR